MPGDARKKGPLGLPAGEGGERVTSIIVATRRDGGKPRPRHCCFCGELTPEADLVGRDRSLLFCEQCVTGLDGLYDGADDALAVFRRTS